MCILYSEGFIQKPCNPGTSLAQTAYLFFLRADGTDMQTQS